MAHLLMRLQLNALPRSIIFPLLTSLFLVLEDQVLPGRPGLPGPAISGLTPSQAGAHSLCLTHSLLSERSLPSGGEVFPGASQEAQQ